MKFPYLSQLVIPKSFDECITYEKQILWLKTQIDTISGGGDPEIINELKKGLEMVQSDVEKLEADVSAIDVSAINESIDQINQEITNIKSSINQKQDKLTFDSTPTENSLNPVISGGIKSYVDNSVREVEQSVNRKVDETTFNQAIQNITNTYETTEDVNTKLSGYVQSPELEDYAKKTDLSQYAKTSQLDEYAKSEDLNNYATKIELSGKQDKLTFDPVPLLGSPNPVTSNGIKEALDSIPSVTLDDNVTENGTHAVKSSGVYSFVQDQTSNLATKDEITNLATKDELSGLATKEELQAYETTSDVDRKLAGYATTQQLETKQDTLTFDETPTLESRNPVTSDGIKKAIDAAIAEPIQIDQSVSAESNNAVSSSGVYNFVVDQVSGLATTEQLANKQDKLTFDDTPTEGSNNPVTSSGIKSALDSIPSVTLDDTVTAEGTNAVKSSGVYNFVTDSVSGLATKEELSDYATTQQLETKQDALTFDETPTLGSRNPVTSDGIKKAIDSIPSVTLDDTVTADGTNAVKSSGVYNFVTDSVSGLATKEELSGYATTEQLANKQDKLTFDDTPTAGSNNPVTSSGIKAAIDAIQPSTLEDTVTQESGNAVKSSGIYSFVNDQVSGKQDTLTFDERPTRESTNPVTSGGVFNALTKSWQPVGSVTIEINDTGHSPSSYDVTANVRLQSGGYGAAPSSIVIIDFELTGSMGGYAKLAIDHDFTKKYKSNFIITSLGGLEMVGFILCGVLINGDNKYAILPNGENQDLRVETTDSQTLNNAKVKLIGLVTGNV